MREEGGSRAVRFNRDAAAVRPVWAGGWYDPGMRRVGRWLVRIGVALSLVLAVGRGVLWGRSYKGTDNLTYQRADDEGNGVRVRSAGVRSSSGVITLSGGYDRYGYNLWTQIDRQNSPYWPKVGAGWRLKIEWPDRDKFPPLSVRWEQVFRFAGVVSKRYSNGPPDGRFNDWTHWHIPHSHLLALFCLPPLLWLALAARRGIQRRGRRCRGECLDCGYDLRATPGRCPECGGEAAAPATPGGAAREAAGR